jgi:hypothetical protein
MMRGIARDEREDWQDNRFDRALMSAWGRLSPYVASAGNRLARFADKVETLETTIKPLSDAQLRRTADGLRVRLPRARRDLEAVALAFAAAREATRRHTGMRFCLPLLQRSWDARCIS